MIDSLLQQNRAFAHELEGEIIRSQVMEEMLTKANESMAEQAEKISDLTRQLSEKEEALRMTEKEIAEVINKFEDSAQEKLRGLMALRCQVEELKQTVQESLQRLQAESEEQRRNTEVESLRNQLMMLKEENSHLQDLYTSTVDDNTCLKDSLSQSQTEMNRLQGQLGFQRQMITDIRPQVQPLHEDLRDPRIQPAPEASCLVMVAPNGSQRPFHTQLQGKPLRTNGTLQPKLGNQWLSGADSLQESLSIQSFSYSEGRISSDNHPSLQKNASRLLELSKEYDTLQRHLSEAQLLVTEMDKHAEDCFLVRQNEDSVTRDVIESLVQQNQAFAQELEEQMLRGQEMENMLAEAQEHRTILMSDSQTAVEQLLASLRTKDQQLKELTGSYRLLREENSNLQALYTSTVDDNTCLKDSLSQSQTKINRLQAEVDLQRQMLADSRSQLQSQSTQLQDHEQFQPLPKVPVLLSVDQRQSERPFVWLKENEYQQDTAVQTRTAAIEEASTPEG